MAMKLNPFTGKFDFDSSMFKGVLASAPTSPQQGWLYIDTGDDTLYIYYGTTWQALHILTPAALSYLLKEDGDALLKEDGDKIALEV